MQREVPGHGLADPVAPFLADFAPLVRRHLVVLVGAGRVLPLLEAGSRVLTERLGLRGREVAESYDFVCRADPVEPWHDALVDVEKTDCDIFTGIEEAAQRQILLASPTDRPQIYVAAVVDVPSIPAHVVRERSAKCPDGRARTWLAGPRRLVESEAAG